MSGPYSYAAEVYHQAGFSPLPTLMKTLQVKGVSGTQPMASEEQITKWIKTHGHMDVALRLPKNVIALDIDAYKGDVERLTELENRLGKLPKTWNSDSRGGNGGKLLFRVPQKYENVKWKSSLNGITLCQHTHRYVMVFPSYNKESESLYLWYDGLGGEQVPNSEIPRVTDLPELPNLWILEAFEDLLSTKDIHNANESIEYYINLFNSNPPCEYMKRLITECEQKLREGYITGLHEAGISVIGKIVNAATYGHGGINEALTELAETFANAPRKRNLMYEWNNELAYVFSHLDVDGISVNDACGMTINFTKKEKVKDAKLEKYNSDFKKLREAGYSLRLTEQILGRQ